MNISRTQSRCLFCKLLLVAVVLAGHSAAVCGQEKPVASESERSDLEGLPRLPALPALPAPTLLQDGDSTATPRTESPDLTLPAEPSLADLLRVALLEAMPDTFVDERHWGRQEERFSGVSVRGLNVSVREKLVNHGFWRRFAASMIEPEENLKLQINALEKEVQGRNAFDTRLSLRARTEATFVAWTYGVKGINGTVRSNATIQADVRLLVTPSVQFDWQRLVPQLGLDIRVAHIDLKVTHLDVHHIGFFGGWVAEQLGDGSRQAVNALIDMQEGRLAAKLQRRLDRLKLDAPATSSVSPAVLVE